MRPTADLTDLAVRLRGYCTDGVARGWPDVEADLLAAADLTERVERVIETTWDDDDGEQRLMDEFDLTYDMEFDAFHAAIKWARAALTGEGD